MEVEGTEAFKLRFKGDTEKKVMKAMNSPYGVVLPEQSVRLNEMNYKQFVKYMNDFYGPKGLYPDKKKRTLGQKEIGMAYSILLKKKPNFEIGFDSTDREMIRDILIKLRKLDPDYNKGQLTKDTNVKEAVNEMSAKSKKIINKLNKKEKEMFMDMIDIMGFDQVMADYKRDKKAFKQALKDMSEGFASAAQRRAAFASGYKAKGKKKKKNENVIQEKFSVKSSKEYFNNLDQAIGLIIRQANNLRGPLAKHPIKRNINKLKAVQTMLKRGLAPAFYAYEKERKVEKSFKGVDINRLKKKLQDGKFNSAVEYSLIPALDTRSYDSNDFYFLKDTKEDKLRKKLVDALYDLRNLMDKAQLENINEDTYIGHYKNKKVKVNAKSDKEAHKQIISKLKVPKKDYDIASIQNLTKKTKTIGDKLYVDSVNEDGHTDVASSKRKVMIMVDDSNKLLNKLNGMNKEDSLPSWWTDKITLSQNYLEKATNYLLNPVDEGFGSDDTISKKEQKKFEKERLENAEVLGYELTGTKDIKESVNENLRPSDKKILMVIATEMVKTNMKGKNENQIRKELPNILSTMGTNDLSKKSPTNRFNKNKMISLGKGFGKLSDSDKKVFINTLMYNVGLAKSINEKKKMFPPDKMTPKQAKEYKKFIDYAKMGIEYKIDMSLFESINEAKEPEVITQLRDIVKRKTNKKIKDPKTKKTMRVDMFTANVITQVYDAIKKNSSHRQKFESLPLDKMAQLSFKMIK